MQVALSCLGVGFPCFPKMRVRGKEGSWRQLLELLQSDADLGARHSILASSPWASDTSFYWGAILTQSTSIVSTKGM